VGGLVKALLSCGYEDVERNRRRIDLAPAARVNSRNTRLTSVRVPQTRPGNGEQSPANPSIRSGTATSSRL